MNHLGDLSTVLADDESGTWADLPVEFRLRALAHVAGCPHCRADVDEQFNIHFSSLKAEGDDPSGAVLAGLVQGKLDVLNNKAAPLLKLPGDKVRVKDLRITLDNALTVDVQFEGTR